jgi:hypothetical protein
MIQCAYQGRLYDFLKDDEFERSCQDDGQPTDPPDIA